VATRTPILARLQDWARKIPAADKELTKEMAWILDLEMDPTPEEQQKAKEKEDKDKEKQAKAAKKAADKAAKAAEKAAKSKRKEHPCSRPEDPEHGDHYYDSYGDHLEFQCPNKDT
jgi:outer membrane biosynthesis protein TonB